MTRGRRQRGAAFLDRDGTLIEEREYLRDPEQVVLLPGVGPALRELARAGFGLVCLSNQSGVARGLFDESDVARVNARLERLLAAHDVALDLMLYAPSHPDFPLRAGWDATWRKPETGMYLAAIERLDLEPARSVAIGDAVRDLEAARGAGITRNYLVRSGHPVAPSPEQHAWIEVVDDVPAAVERILA
ncbi:MAG: HAD-IIIA family hydrolase [Planctomycetota bacterium]